MITRPARSIAALVAALVATSLGAPVALAQFKDRLVQPPQLAGPERGSVKGALAGLGFAPAELARGGFRLPLPVVVPDERGPLQAGVVPAYSPDGGHSEWGMGWSSESSIRRFRILGEVDFATDELTSPWGRLRKGTDGAYYPTGLGAPIRLAQVDGDWVATSFDGTRSRFRAADGVTTARGTFAWQLTEVTSLTGEQTVLAWSKNASGRPFLDRVTWGGRDGHAQYELALGYERMPGVFVDHASGRELVLDRRVTSIKISARDRTSGGFVERWRYRLDYAAAPFGPAFYLKTIQRVFAGGETQPAMVYEYDLDATRLPAARLERYPGLDAALASLGDDAFQPDRAAIHDLDADGRPDLEHAASFTQLRHTDAGWVQSALPPATGTSSKCRPPVNVGNKPRLLARLTADLGEPHVLYTELRGDGKSQVLVCDRLGRPLVDQLVVGDWRLGPNLRLTDVDRDRRPDLVRITPEGVYILRNERDGLGVRFAPVPRFTWSLGFTPDASWLHDFDGDGNVDIVARTSGGLRIYYGLGNRTWAPTGKLFAFVTTSGATLGSLNLYQLTFVDANKDGLTDLLLSKGLDTWLYTNRGNRLVEVPVAGFRQVTWSFGLPVVADLTGRGNVEVAFAARGTAHVVPLSTPGTGLMASADDGMGSVARFAYTRSHAHPGLEQRVTLLETLTVESSGHDPVGYGYEYGQPVAHSVSQQLIGFTTTRRSSPQLVEEVEFRNDDDAGAVVTDTRSIASDAALMRFSATTYQAADWAGVRFLRTVGVTTGVRGLDGTGEVATQVTYADFQPSPCPTRVVTTTATGTLESQTVLATVPALAGLPHCTPHAVQLWGQHARPELDFAYGIVIARNALGQPIAIRQQGATAQQLLQSVDYDTAHRPVAIIQPGLGTASLRWDPDTGLLAEVVAPDGVITSTRDRDPVTDGMRELGIDRGGPPWLRFFRHDGQERLWRSWDDVGVASEAQPDVELTYAFARREGPGRIAVRSLIAPGQYHETVDLTSANGETLATLTRRPGAWAVDGLTTIDRNRHETRGYWRAPLPGPTDLATLDWDTLRGGATPLALARTDADGQPRYREETVADGVSHRVETREWLDGATLVSGAVENDEHLVEVGRDASGQVRWSRDQLGELSQFEYDALGRLVDVTLPDGARLAVRYDDFGRVAEVARVGLATLRYQHDPVTGLVVRRSVHDGDGVLERTVDWSRDELGRIRGETHAQPRTGQTRQLTLRYDGQIDGALVAGQRGHLSQVTGAEFDRTMVYQRDGRPLRTQLAIAGFRRLEQGWTRWDDGAVKDETWVVRDDDGQELYRLVETRVHDASGRLAEVRVDGETFATLGYDGEGRVARVDLATGGGVVYHHDPVTHARSGYAIDGGSWHAGVDWLVDARRNVASETIGFGDQSWLRQHEYDPRNALTRSHDRDGESRYEYGATGLPTRTHDLAGDRAILREARSITAGSVRYDLDASGRVIQRGDLELTWGPTGEIDQASRGGRTWGYLYDEHGARIAKREGGAVTAAFLGGAHLTAERLIVPVTIEGQLVGAWVVSADDKRFELLATDPRGTLLGEHGAPNLPTPYGARSRRPELAPALDYAARGYDADLGTVRMGVRDYDPSLGQFWSPDPLFLEAIDRCAASPMECNLYGYAAGNPLRYVDPDGREKAAVDVAVNISLVDDAVYESEDGTLTAGTYGAGTSNGNLVAHLGLLSKTWKLGNGFEAGVQVADAQASLGADGAHLSLTVVNVQVSREVTQGVKAGLNLGWTAGVGVSPDGVVSAKAALGLGINVEVDTAELWANMNGHGHLMPREYLDPPVENHDEPEQARWEGGREVDVPERASPARRATSRPQEPARSRQELRHRAEARDSARSGTR